MDPISDSSHWILRIVGGMVVAVIAYFSITLIPFVELTNEFALALSALVGILAAALGWNAVKWIFDLLNDL